MDKARHSVSVPPFLNERSVTLLESNWGELRNEAYCEGLDNGWKIHLLGPGKVFVQAGFRNGEKIAPAELLSYAKTSGQKSLVERLLAIFEHIQK